MMTRFELRVALRALGMKQKEFAAHIGITEEHVSRMVRGHRKIQRPLELLVRSMLAEKSDDHTLMKE